MYASLCFLASYVSFICYICILFLYFIFAYMFILFGTEPYNHFGRRGRKEPEALAAASLKRLYVENRPYLVGGHSQHDSFCSTVSSNAPGCSKYSVDLQKLKNSHLHVSKSILSMTEKYEHMKGTFRKRLAFGK